VQPASLQFTLTGGVGTYYLGAASSSPEFLASVNMLTDTTGTVTLSPMLSPGQGAARSGHVTVMLCEDAGCAHVDATQDYPFDYTQFAVDTSARALSGTEGVVNGPVTLSVTPADIANRLTISTQTFSGGAWLSGRHDANGNFALVATGVGVSKGSYSGGASVALASSPNVSHSASVSFSIGPGLVAPTLASLVQQRATTANGLKGSASVAFNGGQAPAWTASSNVPWLVVDTPSGTGPATLRYHVDPTASAAAVTNWDAAAATVTIQSPGLTPVQGSLNFQRQLPDVTMLTPTQVVPNRAATLTLSGRGFSQLDNIGQITVGGQAVASGTILSDSQAVVTLPASAASALQVRVPNALAQPAAQAQVAVASSAFAYATVPTPGNDSKTSMVFDPSRGVVFATSYYGSALQRYAFDGARWTLSSLPWSGAWRLQLSPDRQTLYVLGTSGLAEVDPDTLAVRSLHTGVSGFQGFYFDHPLAITNDLRLWMPQGPVYFDLRRGTTGYAGAEFPGVATQMLTATPDGAHVYTVDGMSSPAPPDGWYSTATHTSVALPADLLARNYHASFDDQGTVGVFEGNAVYRTADWTLAGNLQPTSGRHNYPGAAVSPDGRRVYVLTGVNGGYYADGISVYDTAQLQAGTSDLVLLGTISVANPAPNCSGQYECDPVGRFAIDPTGTTLFWAGNSAFTVIPIPTGLASPNAVSMRTLRKATAGAVRATH
jgi:hypothetical protein